MSNKETIQISGKNPICISFSAFVYPQTASVFLAAITNSVNKGHEEIHVLLSTPGGNVSDGITIYNTIRALPVPVVMYNVGNVNSIGNVVFQSGKRKVAAPSSSFMFHGVGFDIHKETRMELKELQEKVASLKNDQSLISDIMVKHTKLSADDVDELFLNMAFVGAQDALKRGITDEVTEINLPPGLPIQHLLFQG